VALRNDRADAAPPAPSQMPAYWVCLALVLALVALGARIAGTL
jgi:hypothetical protein